MERRASWSCASGLRGRWRGSARHEGSSPACPRRHRRHCRHCRRVRAMSGRHCSLARSVFFYMKSPYPRARSGWRAVCSPRHGLAQLGQGQVGPAGEQFAHPAAVGRLDLRLCPRAVVQRADVANGAPLRQQFFDHAQRNPVTPRHLLPRAPALVVVGHNPGAQIHGCRFHPSL